MRRIGVAAFALGLALMVGCAAADEEPATSAAPAEAAAAPAVDPPPVPPPRLSGAERAAKRQAQLEFAKGYDLMFGTAGVRDRPQAIVHLTAAAEAGHRRAQALLGRAYRRGRGVAADPVQAFHWLSLAAEQGVGGAQLALGEMYRDGVTVEKDPVTALKWMYLAGRAGSLAAKFIAPSYAAILGPEQRREAQALARQWRSDHGLSTDGPPAGEPIAVETVPSGAPLPEGLAPPVAQEGAPAPDA